MIPVIGYHLDLVAFRGGYVGVDIFFVISGYLIGQGIISGVERGEFSLVGFYERRFRRIMPALVAMLAATTVACWAWLTPVALSNYAWSLAAATASISNFWFLEDSGYFAGPATSKPLLHTWSLAVEEQFYLFAPLLLPVLVRRQPAKLTVAVAVIAVVSLAVAAIGAFWSPNTTFYMLHTRAWELALGVLATRISDLPQLGARWREAFGALGLSGLAFGFAICSFHIAFPGLAAVPSTVGAAFLIVSSSTDKLSTAGRLLALRPLVWTGLISYSLYLWHWPIIVLGEQGGAARVRHSDGEDRSCAGYGRDSLALVAIYRAAVSFLGASIGANDIRVHGSKCRNADRCGNLFD